MKIKALIKVYGSNQPCQSCIQAPPSKDTFEWLEAALKRKFSDQLFEMKYIDLDNPPTEDVSFVEQIREDELFYPIVTINNEIITEGNPTLKPIFKEMEKLGYKPNEVNKN